MTVLISGGDAKSGSDQAESAVAALESLSVSEKKEGEVEQTTKEG